MTESDSLIPKENIDIEQRLKRLEKRLERLELKEMHTPKVIVCFQTVEELSQAEHVLGYLNKGVHTHSRSLILNYADAELLVESGIPMYTPPESGNERGNLIDGNSMVEELKKFHKKRYEK